MEESAEVTPRSKRRLVIGLAAAGVLALGIGLLGPSAFAQDGNGGNGSGGDSKTQQERDRDCPFDKNGNDPAEVNV